MIVTVVFLQCTSQRRRFPGCVFRVDSFNPGYVAGRSLRIFRRGHLNRAGGTTSGSQKSGIVWTFGVSLPGSIQQLSILGGG